MPLPLSAIAMATAATTTTTTTAGGETVLAPTQSAMKAASATAAATTTCAGAANSAPAPVPFRHQVGGHHPLARLPQQPHLIAKPVAPTSFEPSFYASAVAHTLRDFIPEFHGTAEVQFPTVSDDSSAEGSTTTVGTADYDDGCVLPPRQRGSLKRSLCREPTTHDIPFVPLTEGPAVHPSEASELSRNPWGLRCFERFSQKNTQRDSPLRCILLEDLTLGFVRPCILDIKMGTRTYSTGATAAKRLRAIAKCAETTSRTLGCRICGMQIFDPVSGRFLCRDKYFGRRLNAESFLGELQEFLKRLSPPRRATILLGFLRVLRRLARTLQGVKTRFYSTSLLLLYEGDPSQPPRCDVRMIDFANVAVGPEKLAEDESTPEHPATSDQGFLLGLRNLIRILSDLDRHS